MFQKRIQIPDNDPCPLPCLPFLSEDFASVQQLKLLYHSIKLFCGDLYVYCSKL